MIREGLAALAALAMIATAGSAMADDEPPVQFMAGDLAGLASIAIGQGEDDYAMVLQVAFVGAPVMVDGAPGTGPTIRIGGWTPDGRGFYETRVLPAASFARLGSSWYLDIGQVPALGAVSFQIEEGDAWLLPVDRSAVGSASGRVPSGVSVETYGRRHEALFVGDAWLGPLRIFVNGSPIDVTHASAHVGERAAIRSTPMALCANTPNSSSCRSLP